MSLRINTNVEAFNAHRNLEGTSNKLAKSMERLSSGFRINRAADDAAGLAISEKLRGQIGGLAQARRNVQDGISLVQTAEGSLTEVHSMLQRSRELAVQYGNGTLATEDRNAIVSEVQQLSDEIERIGRTAQFNGIQLLDGTVTRITFQVGANDAETIDATTSRLTDSARRVDLTSRTVLADIDASINAVSNMRSSFGAVQNRLEHTYNNLSVYQENLSAS
ncbi:flagellin, partial [Conexibacter sp. CPCC 205762]